MIRILHAADFHMDSPFQGLSAEQAVLRRRDAYVPDIISFEVRVR